MGKAEYELDYEEYEIVNKALQEQLQKYKDEFKNLKCEWKANSIISRMPSGKWFGETTIR